MDDSSSNSGNAPLVDGMVPVGVKSAPGVVPDSQLAAQPAASKLPAGVSEQKPDGAPVLGRSAILAQKDKPRRRLYVPMDSWGGTVVLQEMRSKERDAYEQSLVIRSPDGVKQVVSTTNIRAKLCVRVIIDEEGNRVFTDEDAEMLGQLPAAEMDRLWTAAQALSGVSNADVKALAGN